MVWRSVKTYRVLPQRRGSLENCPSCHVLLRLQGRSGNVWGTNLGIVSFLFCFVYWQLIWFPQVHCAIAAVLVRKACERERIPYLVPQLLLAAAEDALQIHQVLRLANHLRTTNTFQISCTATQKLLCHNLDTKTVVLGSQHGTIC